MDFYGFGALDSYLASSTPDFFLHKTYNYVSDISFDRSRTDLLLAFF
jgi:hypothetical protein